MVVAWQCSGWNTRGYFVVHLYVLEGCQPVVACADALFDQINLHTRQHTCPSHLILEHVSSRPQRVACNILSPEELKNSKSMSCDPNPSNWSFEQQIATADAIIPIPMHQGQAKTAADNLEIREGFDRTSAVFPLDVGEWKRLL
jgi:hypothetical protein